MAESLNKKRAVFARGKQREFILRSKEDLDITWVMLAEISCTSLRNLTGWKNEKHSMSLLAVKQICKKRHIAVPLDIVVKDAYWYASHGAAAGGRAVVEKYGKVGGDERYRKKRWEEWWEREGRLNPSEITKPAPFKKPEFSEVLAEFAGIALGDGGISEHQITISLNRISDGNYFGFVQGLVRDLFDVPVGRYSDKHSLADRIVISRTTLVSYLVDVVGLKRGNKVRQQVDIPAWVKKDSRYSVACVRGLIDTDGCVILHRYLSKGKEYCYKKIGFTSHSFPLLQSVSSILFERGIGHRITKSGWDIRIEAKDDVERYFQIIGTHNQKHSERYKRNIRRGA